MSLFASSYYARSNNQLRVLLPIAIGLVDNNGNPLFDSEQAPWSTGHIKVKDWRPENKHFSAEVDRLYSAYGFNRHIKRKPETK